MFKYNRCQREFLCLNHQEKTTFICPECYESFLFENAKNENTLIFYKSYLREFPDGRYAEKTKDLFDSLLPQTIYIPAGEYMIGSEDGNDEEKPVHKVSLDAYI